jgi:hypothetical protein
MKFRVRRQNSRNFLTEIKRFCPDGGIRGKTFNCCTKNDYIEL